MNFTKPELEIIRFSIMDVIQTSITPKPGQEEGQEKGQNTTPGYIYAGGDGQSDPFGGGGEIQ